MSRTVFTPLLIAAGVVGIPVVLGVAQCARQPEQSNEETPPTVNTETSYPNNHFLPGAGYYHAPYHAWFPLPFNHHDSARGWFRGGSWRGSAQPDATELRPGAKPVGTSGLVGTQSFSNLATSRPTPEAVIRANAGAKAKAGTVIRGGFGHSSRPSIS